jgi:fimbrial isopeptide formation D2 family protein
MTNLNMKKLLFFIATGILFLIPFNITKAATICTPVYGGGQNCVTTGNIGISKTVMNPSSRGYTANLTINDPKYAIGQTVNFQVTVTNNDSDVNTITVTDTFPQYFHFVSGPGSFSANNNTLTWITTGLAVGQSQTFTISGTITGSVPTGIVCTTNQVSEVANNGDSANASSQYCIVNAPSPTPTIPSVLPAITVKSTPPTGSEALVLFALLPGALTGLGFIRLSKKSKSR